MSPVAAPTARHARFTRQLIMESATAEVMEGLATAGVPALLLKGAAFAHWLYEEPVDRGYSDIDVLVAPERRGSAGEVIHSLGYEPRDIGVHPHERAHHHTRWERTTNVPALVELHHSLGLLNAPAATVWSRLSAGAGELHMRGQDIPIPGEAASLLIVSLHACQHGTRAPRPMEDLRRALACAGEPAWRAAAVLATELDASGEFLVGLQCEPDGRALARALGLSGVSSGGAQLLATTPPATALGIQRLAATVGLRLRLRLLWLELFPSRSFMRSTYAGADRGRLGLLRAYIERPFRLAVKLPAGYRRWRAVARRSRA